MMRLNMLMIAPYVPSTTCGTPNFAAEIGVEIARGNFVRIRNDF